MSADPIDEHAERLFASARREGASERLVQRVLSDMATADGQRALGSCRPSPRGVRWSRPLAAALLAAAACGVAAITWSTLAPSPSAPSISAEVEPRREREPRTAQDVNTEATPTAAILPVPAVAPGTQPGRLQHAEKQPEPVERSSPPRRRASSRTPIGAQSPTTSMPLAPSTTEAAPVPPPPGSAVAPTPGVSNVTETPRALTLSDELQALERARAALRGGDGRAALRLLDEGGTARFSRLAAEATLLRIEALYAVGELSESRRVAEEFTTGNPDSHLGDRARSFIRQIDASRNTAGSSPR